MAFAAVTEAEISNDQFVTHSLMTKLKDNFDALYAGMVGVSGLSNGSFEIDSDSNGSPDNWTITLYSGGSSALYTTSPGHGAKALAFTHPGGAGNGGGYADSDYFEVDGLTPLIISGLHWCTAAGMKCEVIVKWCTAAKVSISNTTAYLSTSNPTTATRSLWLAAPPSTARYAKIYLIGGRNDTDVAGTAYFDGVVASPCLSLPCYGEPADTYTAATVVVTSTTATSATKVGEGAIPVSGGLRISFVLASYNGGATAYARIYRNGSPVGTLRSTTSSSPVTYSEDIAGWKPGDLLQMYAYTSDASYMAVPNTLTAKTSAYIPA